MNFENIKFIAPTKKLSEILNEKKTALANINDDSTKYNSFITSLQNSKINEDYGKASAEKEKAIKEKNEAETKELAAVVNLNKIHSEWQKNKDMIDFMTNVRDKVLYDNINENSKNPCSTYKNDKNKCLLRNSYNIVDADKCTYIQTKYTGSKDKSFCAPLITSNNYEAERKELCKLNTLGNSLTSEEYKNCMAASFDKFDKL